MGEELMSRGFNLLSVMQRDYTQWRRFFTHSIHDDSTLVVKGCLTSLTDGLVVAIKHWDSNYTYENGIEQFRAVRALQKEGIICATPLIATKTKLISPWIDGPVAPYGQELTEYLTYLGEIVNKLKYEGRWEHHWHLDHRSNNYIVRDLSDRNPRNRFIAIDPMCFPSLGGL